MLKAIDWKREHPLQLAVGRQQGDAELLRVAAVTAARSACRRAGSRPLVARSMP